MTHSQLRTQTNEGITEILTWHGVCDELSRESWIHFTHVNHMSTEPAKNLTVASQKEASGRRGFLEPMSRHSKRIGATLLASKEIIGSSRLRLPLPVHDIRLRILSLVVFAALAPALLVGTASYSTARKILTEKLSEQLSAQAFASERLVNQFLSDRYSDTKVFASADVVSRNLRNWIATAETGDPTQTTISRARLEQYLSQVQERYPLYRSLYLVDLDHRLVATTNPTFDTDLPEWNASFLESRQQAPFERRGGEVLAYVHHPVIDQNYLQLGTLITSSSLDGLWETISADTPNQSGELKVIDRDGWLLFDTSSSFTDPNKRLVSEGTNLLLSGQNGVAEYTSEDGVRVLGAYRYQPSNQLGYLVEVSRDTAFAASLWLRNFALLVSFVAAGLVTAIAVFVMLSLTRPIDALIAGAKAAAGGDLSQEIPISSKDQIGYLTEVFNRMTATLQESREKLEKASRTDELTGLPNRRELDRMFKMELSRAERTDRPLSVLMIDLDKFKEFNDRYGHLKGDSLLSEVSHFLNLSLRPADIATRFGGEEFIVLLPDATKRQATSLAERLRRAFDEGCSNADDNNPWVTISIGVSTWPEDGKSKEDLIRAADSALYAAKRAGRNRIRAAVFPAPLVQKPAVDPDEIA